MTNDFYFNCRFSYYDGKPPPPIPDEYIKKCRYRFIESDEEEEYDYRTSFNYNDNSIHPVFKIKKSSSMEEFKEVYKQMILETHPDKGGSNEKFIRVRDAWEDLITDSTLI